MRRLWLILLAPQAVTAAVSFTNDIAPIFAQKCVACHGEQKAKGNFQLHTFEFLRKGVKGEPVLAAGKPEESSLFQALISADEDSRMPQEDDPLPSPQIALIKQWIAEGAKFDGPDPKASLRTLVASLNFPEPPEKYPHAVPVVALAFSADGTELVSSGYHEALVWKAADGKLLRRIKGLPQRVQALALSADGKMLAIASGTPGRVGQVHALETARGDAPTVPLCTTPDVVLSVAFSPDGSALAAGGADNAIRVFEMPSGQLRFKTEQHADWVLGVAFHPETNLLVSASRDKTARVLDALTGELEATYQGHSDWVFAAVFSEDGKRAYSAGRDKKIHVWEIKEGKKSSETAAEAEIYRLVSEGKELFACGTDKVVRHFKADDKVELLRALSGHEDAVYALAFHARSRRLASGSHDGEIRIWNADTGEKVLAFKATPNKKH